MKTQKGSVLIVDIGSASVAAGVLSQKKNGLPLLEKTTRVPIGTGSEETRTNLKKAMEEALTGLLKSYEGTYASVRVVVGSPWYQAHIRTVHTKSERPATVSLKSVEAMLDKYKSEVPPTQGYRDIEAVAVQTQVNGYPTNLTRPVSGTTIRVNLYESEMEHEVHTSLTALITSVARGPLSFHTSPLVTLSALRVVTDETSFIFLDISGEVTDLGVIHADSIQFLASYPIGFRSFIRAIGGEHIGDTTSRLALWARDELSPDEAQSFSEKFLSACTGWQKEYEESLTQASEVVPIPRTAFILSDKESVLWIKKGFEYSSRQLSITAVTPTLIQRFIELGEGGVYDVFLVLGALFFHMGTEEIVGEPEPRRAGILKTNARRT